MSELLKYNIEIAGVGFENKNGEERRSVARRFLDNDTYENNVTVFLKREKGNRNDKNAIAVYLHKKGFWYSDEAQIGYIPREYAKEISPQLDMGGMVENIRITRVWMPDSLMAKPYIHISFDSSWTKDDVKKYIEEKKIKDREYRAYLKARKEEQAEKEKIQAEKQRSENLFFLIMVFLVIVVCCVSKFFFS